MMFGGPRHWINLPIAFMLDHLFGMPGAFPSLQLVALAAKLSKFLQPVSNIQGGIQP